MFATFIYLILKISDIWSPWTPTGPVLLDRKKLIAHNYKQFDDKEIHTKDTRTPLLCTEHLIIGNKACSVKRLNGEESEVASAICSCAIANLVISM